MNSAPNRSMPILTAMVAIVIAAMSLAACGPAPPGDEDTLNLEEDSLVRQESKYVDAERQAPAQDSYAAIGDATAHVPAERSTGHDPQDLGEIREEPRGEREAGEQEPLATFVAARQACEAIEEISERDECLEQAQRAYAREIEQEDASEPDPRARPER